jgi:hypothetical protein
MKVNADAAKARISAELNDAISFVEGSQLVQFKSRGNEYTYALSDEFELWQVPPEERDGFCALLDCLRQLDAQVEDLKVDQLAANKFISRYYRMQADKLAAIEAFTVSVSKESRGTGKRLTRAARLLEGWRKRVMTAAIDQEDTQH